MVHVYAILPIDFWEGGLRLEELPQERLSEAGVLVGALNGNPVNDVGWRDDPWFGFVPSENGLVLWCARKLENNGTVVVASVVELGLSGVSAV